MGQPSEGADVPVPDAANAAGGNVKFRRQREQLRLRDFVARNRIPLKRFGTPREIADAATYLLSDGAGYVTGDCLTVDGGEWLRNGGEFSYATDFDRDNLKQMLKSMRGKEK